VLSFLHMTGEGCGWALGDQKVACWQHVRSSERQNGSYPTGKGLGRGSSHLVS